MPRTLSRLCRMTETTRLDAGARVALSTDAGVAPGRRHDVPPDDLVPVSTRVHQHRGTIVTAAAAASRGLKWVASRRATTLTCWLLRRWTMTQAGLCDRQLPGAAETQVPLQASAVGYNTRHNPS